MEDIKQYEAAVIRRVCYMVNACEKNVETLSKSFYFTNQLSFDKWYELYEGTQNNSWVLSSFYKLYNLFFEREAERITEKENVMQQVLIPACEAINQAIDTQNENLKYFFSDQFLIENTIEALTQNGYSYDNAQRQAKTFVSDPKFRNQFDDNIKKQYNEPFETKIKNINKDFDIDVARLWSSKDKKYRHATPDDITYYGGAHVCVKDDAIGVEGVTVCSFEEYQYVLAIKDIFDRLEINDNKLDSVIESAREFNLTPEQNENGLPGAKWDVLQTVFSENPDFEEDIISLVHFCAHYKEPNIKESWLFQYADVLPLSQTEDQKEAEDLLVQTAKGYYSSYFKAVVALAKCVQMNTLFFMGNALGGNAEPPQTVAEVMDSFYLTSDSFESEEDQKFISDFIELMQSDGIELDITGMDKYIVKKTDKVKRTSNITNGVAGTQSGTKAKNKWVAILLCVFLGGLGIHKFYEEKMGMGVLYLLTGGVFGIGVIVDLFKLLFKTNPYYV